MKVRGQHICADPYFSFVESYVNQRFWLVSIGFNEALFSESFPITAFTTELLHGDSSGKTLREIDRSGRA